MATSRSVRRTVLVLTCLLAAGPAAAETPGVPSSELWATVNICDTPASPNAVGVRAAMPGDGTRSRMYVRFRAQFWSEGGRHWVNVTGNGLSPWIYAGRARFRSRQAGWTFSFRPPPANSVFLVRSVAYFQWRARKAARRGHAARWVVVMRRRRVTRSGVQGADGGDPPGTSRGSCYIT
jgi:hypothetical protein